MFVQKWEYTATQNHGIEYGGILGVKKNWANWYTIS